MAIKINLKYQQITQSSHYKGLPINASETNPSYISIIEKTYRELTKLIAGYYRVVIVRVDLHPAEFCNPLLISMTDFCRSFQRKLENKYKGKVVYQWVQEQGRKIHNKGMHWHLWVGVRNHPDHREKRQAREMSKLILDSWNNFAGGLSKRNHISGWFFLERDKLTREKRLHQQELICGGGQGVLINMNHIRNREKNKNISVGGVIDECFYSLSYLAKVYSKVRTPNTQGRRLNASTNIRYFDKADQRKNQISTNLEKIDCWMKDKLSPRKLEFSQ